MEPAINKEFYSEKEDYTMNDEDLAMFFYIKLNEINFNFPDFFKKQVNINEENTKYKDKKEDIEIKNKENNENNENHNEEIIEIIQSSINLEENKSTSSKNSSPDLSIRRGNLQKLNQEDLKSQIQTKSNLIINKLKKITKKATLSKEKESLEDLQWILQTISENNLNEPEIKYNLSKLKFKQEKKNQNTGEDFLSKY